MKKEEVARKSDIEIFLYGNNVRINEFYSKQMTEKILKHAEQEYGIVFKKKCQSPCG